MANAAGNKGKAVADSEVPKDSSDNAVSSGGQNPDAAKGDSGQNPDATQGDSGQNPDATQGKE
jgi:hypothetical protein